jgi:hypothetical protein
MKTSRWLAVGIAVMAALRAQGPEIDLPRPGAVLVASLQGEAFITAGGERKPVRADERLRVGSTLATGRKTALGLALSNGVLVDLGSEAELEVEEFGQAPVAGSFKFPELKEEPTLSRTKLRLVRGAVTVTVKPLKVSRGSTFTLATPAGTLRTGEAVLRAMVRMSDLGLGVCTLEVVRGSAQMEIAGGAPVAVPAGRQFTYALEVDKASGEIKVGDMPEAPKKK